MTRHTISALVQNKPGVLARMAEEFGKYQVNIISIACGETHRNAISRMVISVDADSTEVARITSGMQSMDFVIQVDDLSRKEFVDRELVMVKVDMNTETSSQIMQIVEVFRAVVVGMGETTLTVEMTGDEDRVDGLIKLLKPFGIQSMCRSGKIALKRGDD